MTAQETSYDAIVRVEIAIKILNEARAIINVRVYELKDAAPDGAEVLRRRRRDLIDLQQSLSADGRDAVEEVIAVWGPRVQDGTRFWAEI